MEAKENAHALAVEHSITTKFRKTIWRNFLSAIKKYNLIEENDVIAVCVSGGKDSLLLAVCLRLLEKYSDIPFKVKFLSMNPGYEEAHANMIIKTAEKLGLELAAFNSDILSVAETAASPCHVCSAMRRGYLYKEAKKLGCNKIALGHHFDDAVETVLISLFYAGEFKTMMPKLSSSNYEGMELIRPLYHIREKYIVDWMRFNSLEAITCACSVTKREDGGKRKEVKNLLASMEKTNPTIYNNIFASLEELNLQTILSYRFRTNGKVHSCMDPNGVDKSMD